MNKFDKNGALHGYWSFSPYGEENTLSGYYDHGTPIKSWVKKDKSGKDLLRIYFII